MSEPMIAINGYGWTTSADSETLRNFILNHRDAFEKAVAGTDFEEVWEDIAADDEADMFDMLIELEDPQNYFTSAYSAISIIISEEQNIPVESVPECDNYPGCILLQAKLPWEMSEKEKNLTEDSLKAILLPYIRELNDDEDSLGSQQFEYY